MIDRWKRAWREAVANFWRELDRRDEPSDPTARTAAMRRDIGAAKAEYDRIRAELQRARRHLDEEREAERQCLRRQALASEIGDEETARIAAEFAARHAERARVLEQKVLAFEAEADLLRRDLDRMESALRDVETATRELGGAFGARIDPGSAAAAPDDEDDVDFRRMEKAARERAAEQRLQELKRKMGR